MNIDKCGNCGAQMKFDAFTHSIICQSCGNSESVDMQKGCADHFIDLNSVTKKTVGKDEEVVTAIKCHTCGATQMNKIKTIADKCQYCSASLFVEENEGDAPDGCVLFGLDRETAIKNFKTSIVKRKFLPSAFKKNPPMDKMEAIYFPSFIYNTDGDYKYRAKLARKDGDDVYRYWTVTNQGTFREGPIMIEGSRYLTQKNFNEISPFDTNQIFNFDKKFIAGYSVEYFNRNIEETAILAKNLVYSRVRSSITEGLHSRCDKISEFDMDLRYINTHYSYVLLPVYKINYKYGNKDYSAFVNGQSGKVGGQVPRSKIKIFMFILFILAVLGLGLVWLLGLDFTKIFENLLK